MQSTSSRADAAESEREVIQRPGVALAPRLLQAFLQRSTAEEDLPGVDELRDSLRSLSEEEDTAEQPAKRRRRCATASHGAGGQASRLEEISEEEIQRILRALATQLAIFTAAVEPEETEKKLRLLPLNEGSASLKALPSYLPLLRYLQYLGAAMATALLPDDADAQSATQTGKRTGASGGGGGPGGDEEKKPRKPEKQKKQTRGKRGGGRKGHRAGQRGRGRYARRHGRRRRRSPRRRRPEKGTRMVLATFSLLPVPPPGKVPFWRFNNKTSPALREMLKEELEAGGELHPDEIIGKLGKHITQSALILTNLLALFLSESLQCVTFIAT